MKALSRSYRTKLTRCPYCDCRLDRAAGFLNDEPPTPGDWTVCIGCAQFLIFDENIILRKPRNGELEAMNAEDPTLKVKIETLARAVRDVDRRPSWEKAGMPHPINRQERRRQERHARKGQRMQTSTRRL
jgi:hypothetical protein